MKLSIRGMVLAAAILWGGCILFIGICNLIWPYYGIGFLSLVGSLYPGYHAGTGFCSVIVGTVWALIDGAIAGALFAWLYNIFA